MKIRRIAATAVAAAVTAPVVFLSAAPAFADTKPAAGASQLADSPIEKLKLAVAAAQAKYDAAVTEYKKVYAKEAAFLDDNNHPLQVAAQKANQESKDAKAAKTAADDKLAAAEATLAAAEKALAELPADATDEQKAEAQQAVDAAKPAVETARTAATAAKADADTKAVAASAASKELADARIAALQRIRAAEVNRDEAKKALDAAKKALKEAQEEAEGGEEPCKTDKNIGMSLTGPKKITVGSSGVFTFRVTNKGKVPFGGVGGSAAAFHLSGALNDHFKLSWSSADSPKWRSADFEKEELFFSEAPLPAGKSFDFKLKVDVDAKTSVGDGQLLAIGMSVNADLSDCGEAENAVYANFSVVKPAKPGSGDNNGTNGGTKGNGNASPQGGTSKTPVTTTTHTPTTTTGRLAATGAGPSTLPFALAGGAAVVLGAGAMVMVRRRKAGEGA